jgi:hypothetical protein
MNKQDMRLSEYENRALVCTRSSKGTGTVQVGADDPEKSICFRHRSPKSLKRRRQDAQPPRLNTRIHANTPIDELHALKPSIEIIQVVESPIDLDEVTNPSIFDDKYHQLSAK